ncbi:hypothetical protein CS542_06615 [Pedobacter sp. IW39]|nr:hypothetical protein CS542_06615 [Pedobacter sp. IW39]
MLMAGKAKAMSQIKQLRLHQQGDSIKSIARILGISKNTVKSYLIKLAAGKLAELSYWLLKIQYWKVNSMRESGL